MPLREAVEGLREAGCEVASRRLQQDLPEELREGEVSAAAWERVGPEEGLIGGEEPPSPIIPASRPGPLEDVVVAVGAHVAVGAATASSGRMATENCELLSSGEEEDSCV